MDNTNETEEKKASGFQDSSPTDNADEEEELEIDEVSFSGGCPCGQSSNSKSF